MNILPILGTLALGLGYYLIRTNGRSVDDETTFFNAPCKKGFRHNAKYVFVSRTMRKLKCSKCGEEKVIQIFKL